MAFKDISGRKFGKLTALYRLHNTKGRTKWLCVCDEWLKYDNFKNWAIANGYNDNLTIDRIDNNGNYNPDNCRWVDMKQQARNRRSNYNYTLNGVTHCLMEWCEIYNIKYKKVYKRLKCGWSIERALELEEK